MPQTFGQWMRAQRQMRGWTITRCAERAEMKWQSWQRLENDDPKRRDGSPSQPTRHTVERVARALDVPEAEAMHAAGYLYSGMPPNALFIPVEGSPVRTDAEGNLSTDVNATIAHMQMQITQILVLLREIRAEINQQSSQKN